MNITKLVFTEVDGTTNETLSTTGGYTNISALGSDGITYTLFPMAPVTPTTVIDPGVVVTVAGVTTQFVPKV